MGFLLQLAPTPRIGLADSNVPLGDAKEEKFAGGYPDELMNFSLKSSPFHVCVKRAPVEP